MRTATFSAAALAAASMVYLVLEFSAATLQAPHSLTARSAALATDVQAPASVQLALPVLAPAQSAGPNL